MLATYYRPSSPYSSIFYITRNVEFGLYIRGAHHWSAYLLIFLMLVHVLRNLLQGRYKVSRRSWIVGCLIGLVTLGCGFTGSLLIWDQRAYWATMIGISTVDSVPYIGRSLKTFLLGGGEVGPITIGRFYALHTLMLPAFLVALMIFHLRSLKDLWEHLFDFLRRAGIVGAGEKGNLEGMVAPSLSRLSQELMEIFTAIGVVLVLALLFPPELGEKANPLMTPAEIKPEWYFLFLYEGLKYVPKGVGIILFFLVLPVSVILLPLLDRSPSLAIHPVNRPLAAILVLLGVAAFLSLTILGWLA
jgi:ubiquinol-cytochrome c reductase cytochrome b subunit